MTARRWPGLIEARGIRIHPAAKLFPMLADVAPDQFRELVEDIRQNGIQQPLVFWTPTQLGRAVKEKYLLDGRNRLDALEAAFGHDAELFTQKLEDAVYIDVHEGARLLYGGIGDTDPWDFVVSANLRRRHLSIESRKAIAAELLKQRPERSDRQIGGQVGLDHKTTGTIRAGLERRGEIPHVSTRIDSAGRQQPATKPPQPPPTKEGQPRAMREARADAQPAAILISASDAGRVQNAILNAYLALKSADSADLRAARRGLDAGQVAQALEYIEGFLQPPAQAPGGAAGRGMSAPELRPYQTGVIARIWAAIEAAQRGILLVAPTGSGKTVIAAEIVRDAVRRGWRVLFLAHRRELIGQASRKLYAAGVEHGIILPGYPMRLTEPVQVASIASLHARAIRSSTIDMPAADLVIIDEAHHCRARTYKRILEAYPEAGVIGMTATPCRGDGRGLGNVFEVLVECPQVDALIAERYLVPALIYAPSRPDLAGVRVERGDYVERQLAERMDKPQLVGDIVSHWHRIGERRRTVVFATGVEHSVHLRDEFRRSGVLAEHIDGSTPIEERDEILARLARGEVEVVCNCMVLTEGFDAPDIGCLVLARPTRSLGLYRQMIGRGLRPAPGKTDCLIIDHAGAVFAHGFPDDPIEWTLAEDRRAENKAHAARGAHKAPALTDCPECRAVRFEGQPCPACGWRPRPKPAGVEIVDGELGRVERGGRVAAAAIDQERYYRQLLGVAQQRGYKPAFAYYKFLEKFGRRPGWNWQYLPPEMPSAEVLAWVRSRQIAYAKAKASAP